MVDLPKEVGKTLMIHVNMNETIMQMLRHFIAFDVKGSISALYHFI